MVRNEVRVLSFRCHRLARWNFTFLATCDRPLMTFFSPFCRDGVAVAAKRGKERILWGGSCSRERKYPLGKPVALKCGSFPDHILRTGRQTSRPVLLSKWCDSPSSSHPATRHPTTTRQPSASRSGLSLHQAADLTAGCTQRVGFHFVGARANRGNRELICRRTRKGTWPQSNPA